MVERTTLIVVNYLIVDWSDQRFQLSFEVFVVLFPTEILGHSLEGGEGYYYL